MDYSAYSPELAAKWKERDLAEIRLAESIEAKLSGFTIRPVKRKGPHDAPVYAVEGNSVVKTMIGQAQMQTLFDHLPEIIDCAEAKSFLDVYEMALSEKTDTPVEKSQEVLK